MQHAEVDFVIDTLPVFEGMDQQITGMHNFKVMEGFSAETSGGILCMISPDKVADFIRESQEVHGQTVWQVGKVVKGSRKAKINADVIPISIHSSSFQ